MPKPFIFVLMPFDSSFDDTYKLGIKETCESLNAYCERLDEQIFEENMLDRIYNQINKADIIISDLSGKNANVFYETGYAHALNKKVILLTSSVDDIPFDLKHRSHIIYNKSIVTLKQELKKRIEWFLSNPRETVLPNEDSIELYISGQKLVPGLGLTITETLYETYSYALQHSSPIPIKIDIYNNSNEIFLSPFKIGIIVEQYDFVKGNDQIRTIQIAENSYLHETTEFSKQYPHAWDSVELVIASKGNGNLKENPISLTIRLFYEFGIRDIPIQLKFEKEEYKENMF